jgi:hypothetical protein
VQVIPGKYGVALSLVATDGNAERDRVSDPALGQLLRPD